MGATALRVIHQRDNGGTSEVGRAFENDKGFDIQLHYLPLTQGPARLYLREEGMVQNLGGETPQGRVQLKVLHPRRYTTGSGQEGTRWTEVGTAFIHDRGVDVTLYYAPCAVDGMMRLILRPLDQPAQRGAPGRPPQPGRGAQFGGAAAQPPQGAQAYRPPQHRDQLQQPDPGPQPPPYADDSDPLPF
jgi:hypothetical protein